MQKQMMDWLQVVLPKRSRSRSASPSNLSPSVSREKNEPATARLASQERTPDRTPSIEVATATEVAISAECEHIAAEFSPTATPRSVDTERRRIYVKRELKKQTALAVPDSSFVKMHSVATSDPSQAENGIIWDRNRRKASADDKRKVYKSTRSLSLSAHNVVKQKQGPFTLRQIRYIRDTFIPLHFTKQMEIVSTKMEREYPAIRDVFYKCAFLDVFDKTECQVSVTSEHEHAKALEAMFQEVIALLDRNNLEAVVTRLRHVGAVHAVFRESGLKGDVLERFAELTAEVLCSHDCMKGPGDASRSWQKLIAFVIDELRFGFEKQVRVLSQQRHKSSCERLQQQQQAQLQQQPQKPQLLGFEALEGVEMGKKRTSGSSSVRTHRLSPGVSMDDQRARTLTGDCL